MQALDHRFGDDGLFWMSYDDLCKRFDLLDRTRLFDNEWTVVQSWTSVSVAWVTGYLNTKFVVEIKKAGPTVFVLCQLDDRYFKGLEGKYKFDLHFVLQEEGTPAGDHIVRARGAWFGNRSVSAEVTLKPGKYEVVPKIVAERDDGAPNVYEVVTKVADRNPQKLRQIGMNYDIANAKGIIELTAEEKKKKDEKKKAVEEKKKKEKEEADKEKAEFEAWKKEKKEREEKEKAEKEKTATGDKAPDTKEGEPKITVEPSKASEVATSIGQESVQDDKTGKTETVQVQTSADPPSEPNDKTATSDVPPAPESPSFAKGSAPHLTRPPPSAYGGSFASGPPSPTFGAVPRYYAASDAGPAPPAPQPDVQEGEKKWNAICVLGLRVYSQDPEVSIKLVKPKDAEEGALLDVDGATQAGATLT